MIMRKGINVYKNERTSIRQVARGPGVSKGFVKKALKERDNDKRPFVLTVPVFSDPDDNNYSGNEPDDIYRR